MNIPVILTSLCGLGGIVFQKQLKQNVSYFLMGVFRDIGRMKAYKRRMKQGNGKALVLSYSDLDILLRKDDPLQMIDLDKDDNNNNEDNAQTYTEEELLEYGNGLDGKPILLSIFGRVYDVSQGEKYYGKDGRYHMFAGRDATYALSTGCLTKDCIATNKGSDSTRKPLTESQMNEGKRWLSFFQLHDKYSYVGNLVHDDINYMIDSLLVQEDIDDKKKKNVSNSDNNNDDDDLLEDIDDDDKECLTNAMDM